MRLLRMDEASSQNQLGGGITPAGAANRQNLEEANPRVQYSIPGILHFIQHEWARFEMERSQWELEKAELQAKIAFLNGERTGQENLKNDLVRRIKMLEYALKQERCKYHKLKYGSDLVQGVSEPPPPGLLDDLSDEGSRLDGGAIDGTAAVLHSAATNASWKQSRQLLRQYLQEIGYTDTIIDIRSNRVRSLLGISGGEGSGEDGGHSTSAGVGGVGSGGAVPPSVNGSNDPTATKRPADQTTIRWTQPKKSMTSLEAQIKDAEKAVLDNFDFLATEADMEVDDDDDDEDPDEDEDLNRIKASQVLDVDDEGDTVDALDQDFRYLSGGATDIEDPSAAAAAAAAGFGVASRRVFVGSGGGGPGVEEDALEGLGELAQLTVTNEADSAYDLSSSKETYRKTWTAKYTLRSHFDGVRSLCFHPTEQALITASEDATLKLWNLQKTVPAKKSLSLDVEPVYTFRGHMGPVLCLAITGDGEKCFSAGLDGNIRIWNVPSINVDPYDSYESSVELGSMIGHEDSVWGLSCHPHRSQLLSCSSDNTVRLWSPHKLQAPLINTYFLKKDGVPTSVDFVYEAGNQFVTSFDTANCVIYDLETCKTVTRFSVESTDTANTGSNLTRQINKVVSHPTLPLTITAHEDRHIRFWDNHTGQLVQSMVAHLDAVTSLATDANGLYLLSGSHDCSIRLWQLDSKQCVQEITAHRKKFDESIFDVAFHPTKAFIASAGADALAKVFV
uniref:Striatin-3-like n=4 Tax=Amphipoda TaxID=6821 RepID=A0A6A7FRL8_9CRUS